MSGLFGTCPCTIKEISQGMWSCQGFLEQSLAGQTIHPEEVIMSGLFRTFPCTIKELIQKRWSYTGFSKHPLADQTIKPEEVVILGLSGTDPCRSNNQAGRSGHIRAFWNRPLPVKQSSRKKWSYQGFLEQSRADQTIYPEEVVMSGLFRTFPCTIKE